MKKLFYVGLSTLTMLFAMLGFVKAQTHTVSFNPPPTAPITAGAPITVTVSPAVTGGVLFKTFATKAAAEQESPSVQWVPIDMSDPEDGTPKVTVENPVLAVAVPTGTSSYEVFYAEYTVVEGAVVARLDFPELSKDESSNQYLYGRYNPFKVELTYGGQKQTNFELYYRLEGASNPTKTAYNPANDPLISDVDPEDAPSAIRKAVATDGYAEIMIEYGMAPYFKALAYFTAEGSDEEIVSELFDGTLKAVEVASPSWNTSNRVVAKNTVIKIVDGERNGGCEFYYSKDAETIPYKSSYDNGSDKVFKYNDEQGIVITEDVVLWVIAYKEKNGVLSGSERLRGKFEILKPTVNVSLNLDRNEEGNYAWVIGKPEPTVTVTLPQGEDIIMGAEVGKVAVKLNINDGNPETSWDQFITQLESPLDMTRATEANYENEWMITLSLVEINVGVDTTEITTFSIDPLMMSLAIGKDGEKPAKPVPSVAPGTVDVGTKVTLSCPTEGAEILYTLGIEEPNVKYTEGYEFTVNADMSIKTLARKDGISSDVVTFLYRIPIPELTVEATANPAPGEIPAGTEIEITLSEEQGRNDILGYKLYSTLKEAEEDITFKNTYTTYPTEGKPVPTVETPVLRVGVFKYTPIPRWKYFDFEYIIMKDIPMPVIAPKGGVVEKGTEVEISLAEGAEGAKIHYTLDGSEPNKESTEYTQKITINEDLTLKAIAIKTVEDKDSVSNVAVANFILVPDAPRFDPESCALDSGSVVNIYKGKADTLVVIEGSDFAPVITKSTDSVVSITITKETLLRAYVVKDTIVSKTVRMEYTIKPVANEAKELAGVSIYPNPNDGGFNVSVPVDAEVEVFAANGQMVKRAKVNAGVNVMRLENSGIYFVRISANGQVSIKKVVVR